MHRLENKIPPPAVMVIFGLLMWSIAQASPVIPIASTLQWSLIVIAFLGGIGFGVGGIRSFNKARTTINPLKPDSASSLVSTGLFNHTRNPMYVCLTLVLCSWGVFLASAWAFIGVITFILYITRFQILPEERAMMKLFGNEFTEYKNRVRRWI
jgi:protein-S-isoprenylcysteine O-methyltransferase Ste14